MADYGGLYDKFLKSASADKWKKIGTKRRAGVLAPLFSFYSEESEGIADFYDIKLLADWCEKCGMTILQLLPMNDTGYNYTPYDCQSTFALDPMYIRLSEVKGSGAFLGKIKKIRKKYPAFSRRVDYGVKKEKMKILKEFYLSFDDFGRDFENFRKENAFWTEDYGLYKALKAHHEEKSWEQWEEKYKFRETGSLEAFVRKNEDEINFHIWLQFLAASQFKAAREHANSKGVLLFGDLPFLVSRDSSDVWANQNYFKLDVVSGAPPDIYFALGQRWGMPPYNWDRIKEHGYDYMAEKLKFAEKFYDMFRIDHFVGLFRLWTIKREEPQEAHGLNGVFDPKDAAGWEAHGREIIDAMLKSSSMLPCAEDLGVVPECSYTTLVDYGLPGMDVQRWCRYWGSTNEFKSVDKYRPNSICVISSHDMSPFELWWEEEAGTVDEILVEKLCADNKFNPVKIKELFFEKVSGNGRLRFKKQINTIEVLLEVLNRPKNEVWMLYEMCRGTASEKDLFKKFLGKDGTTAELCLAALGKAAESSSIFTVQLIQDYLTLGGYFEGWDKNDMRVNTPGTVSDKNWSIRMPVSLEDMQCMEINGQIKRINDNQVSSVKDSDKRRRAYKQ